MFRIGDFSRLARVSCRLLRYYDEIGLLKPGATERDSGYRYYTAAQLGRLNRILALRDMGFSLEEIARIVADDQSADELRGMLTMRRRDVERSIESERERLKRIESRIGQIEAEGRLTVDDVLMRDEPARRIASLRQVVGSFAEARGLIGALLSGVSARRRPGPLIAVAHSSEFEADAIDVEVGFAAGNDFDRSIELADGRTLALRELPAAHMAICVRVGLPEHAHLATGKIAQFVAANGYRLNGPSREVFLQPPDPQRMEDSVVEMQFPITPRRSG